MRQMYKLLKATPLRLLLTDTNFAGVGRHKGCEIIPTTTTSLTELEFPTELKEELIQAQNKKYQPAQNELNLLSQLRPYQIDDVLFLTVRKSAGCFNEQRTGKTPTSLLSFKLKGLKKILIICPPSAVLQWQDEYERWYGEPCIAVKGPIKQRTKQIEAWTHGLIIGYDCLKMKTYTNKETGEIYDLGDISMILKQKDVEGVIIDEVHRIRNYKTRTAEAIFKLNKIEHKLVLSGTPTTGSQDEIYSALHFLYPDIFTSYWRFIDYYFTKETIQIWIGGRPRDTTEIGPLKREKELQEFLNVISTSRKRKDVMPWLPDKERIEIKIPLDKDQKRYLDELHKYFETEDVVTQGILDRLIRERQICLAPALLGLSGASPKTTWLKEFLSDYPDKSVIIFSKFTQWLEYLAKELDQPYLIVGRVSKEERNRLKKEFQAGKIKVLLINIDAGKEALTLDRAEVTIFTDKFAPVGDIEQAEDRFVATTEDKADKGHTVYTLVMKGSYEEHIIASLAQRKDEIDLINDYKKYLKTDLVEKVVE